MVKEMNIHTHTSCRSHMTNLDPPTHCGAGDLFPIKEHFVEEVHFAVLLGNASEM